MTIKTLIIGFIGIILSVNYACAQTPQPVENLLKELPSCSRLHEMLLRGEYGDGLDQQYMAEMHSQGVRRAFISFQVTRVGTEIRNFQVVERAYYDEYDGPNSQIVDTSALQKISDSGLEQLLDGLARERVRAAPLFWGKEKPRFMRTSTFYSNVEFFFTPWLQEQRTLLSPLKKQQVTPLYVVASSGNVIRLKTMLESAHFQQEELNRALFSAAISLYDNSAAIDVLINAGANVNAKTKEGDTPLMSAVSRPCNLLPLLARGARVNERDLYGVSALKMAELHKDEPAANILRKAGAQD